ncbi:serine/threonine-protein phosphatase 6 regulatory ankyrin repeat subunit A-like [Haliotis rufescens]|uniref:serine/threonine-protein phosphatase 6 regulatory ankyrin repeat subunit A-like n=1 Tax=Haliotis rufescens TaxID=6454 RepID=UPI00201F40B9|nr:serine/threonine-protein phosphatase 6 regulatory ankyrin repeat subunit A-like [Haliotis rufescens]
METAHDAMKTLYDQLSSEPPGLPEDFVLSEVGDLLFWASLAGNTSLVRDCLDAELYDIDRQVHKQRSAVMEAALKSERTIYQLLMSEGADLSLTDEDGNNCLHLAVEGGSEYIVNNLLSWGKHDVNAGGKLGRTAVHVAALSNHKAIFNILVAADVDVSVPDAEGNNCLHLAAEVGSMGIVRDILVKRPQEINALGAHGCTALVTAVLNNHHEMVDYLVSMGADVSIRTDKLLDCLTASVVAGHDSVLLMLLEMEMFDINRRGLYGRTAVMVAALLGKREEYDALVSVSADVKLLDDFGNDCLLLAAIGGSEEIVRHLISLNVFNINRQQENQSTPVFAAISHQHQKVFDLLVAEEADVTLTSMGDTCLIKACETGNCCIVETLIAMKSQDINYRGQHGRTAVMMAALKGHVDILQILVSVGADLALIDDDGNDCLMLASVYGHVQVAQHLLCMDNVFDVNKRGQDGMSAVMAAAHEGNDGVFNLMVHEKADLLTVDDYGSTCLIQACIGGNANIVQYLLDMKIFDVESRGNDGWTPLMAAAAAGHQEVFQMLVEAGADVTVKDAANDNCLMLASMGGNAVIVQELLQMKTFEINGRGGKGWTAVMFAAFYGQTEIFDILVKSGAKISLTDNNNDGCLILAAAEGHVDIVRRLLAETSVDVNGRGRRGCTPLLVAAHGGHTEVFQLLLSHRGDLAVVDENGANFTHYAKDWVRGIVKDVPLVRRQLISELRTSTMRSSSFAGSIRSTFGGLG